MLKETNQWRVNPSTSEFRASSFEFVSDFEIRILDLPLAVRYLVKARIRKGKADALRHAINDKTLGAGSIAGDEYQANMDAARLYPDGTAKWVETCFCDPPLAEERPYWEEFFELVSVKDAHARGDCRHENGTEPWACCDCDCTAKLEAKLAGQGQSFLKNLRR